MNSTMTTTAPTASSISFGSAMRRRDMARRSMPRRGARASSDRDERYTVSIAMRNAAVALPPAGTTRNPSWLRSASIGAVIGSKQMIG